MIAMVFLLTVLLVLFWLFNVLSHRSTAGWWRRESFLLASIAWGTLVVLITEVTSILGLMNRGTLLLAWVLTLCVAGAGLLYLHVKQPLAVGRKASTATTLNRVPGLTWGMLGLILVHVLLLALVALIYAPNNWDSMTYHLARVMHWQQAGTVAHYATHYEPQIQHPPFAEFVLTHLLILDGNDYNVNLLQWFALVLSAVGVSVIAQRLGADRNLQVAAALLAVSIPMGILQATSTQNDYVVASWLVCFVASGLALMAQPRNVIWIVATGLALGLAFLTKATAIVYAFPFSLWFGFALLRQLRGRAIPLGTLIVVLALSVTLGHYTRNTLLYGSPTGPHGFYSNDMYSPRVLASNLIRNAALHVFVPVPVSAVQSSTRLVLRGLEYLHGLTGLSPTDSRTSWGAGGVGGDGGGNIFVVGGPSFDEDYAGNPAHATLIALTLAVAAFSLVRRRRINTPAYLYMAMLLVAFLIFCLYLRWQIWGSRLHLPLFVLWAPAVVVVLFSISRRLFSAVVILVALFAFMWTFNNATRPLNFSALTQYDWQPRTHGYFTKRPDLLPADAGLTNMVANSDCPRVGLILGEDGWEYPIWMMLRDQGFRGEINHVMVANQSGIYNVPEEWPCAVISRGRVPIYGQHLPSRSYSGFTLYVSSQYAAVLGDVPEVFTLSSGIDVTLLEGWYDYEYITDIRWMQSPGSLEVEVEQDTNVVMRVVPFGMNEGGGFGYQGELVLAVNGVPLEPFPVSAGTPSEAQLRLQQGANIVTMELLAGNFTSETDPRLLGVAFSSIEIAAIPPD
jgi:4-amino-4-deoxy-L-arabinose transferase-like glycosyltransferase